MVRPRSYGRSFYGAYSPAVPAQTTEDQTKAQAYLDLAMTL